MRALNQAEGTISDNVRAVDRFFELIDVDWGGNSDISGGETWYISVICAVYQAGIMSNLLNLEIMSPSHTWARKIGSALSHLCGFAALRCGELRFAEAKNSIECFADQTLAPYKRKCSAAKKAADIAKSRADAQRLKSFPEIADIKVAVRAAMVDLLRISHNANATGAMTGEMRSAANCALVGVLYFNGFAGRSGEWQKLSRGHVEEQLAAGKDHVVCKQHKTVKHYGELAKWLAPGTRAALAAYIALPGKHTDLLLDPVRSTTDTVSIHKLLPAFGATYCPKQGPPACNLVRKLFHTKLVHMNRQGLCLDLLSKVDAHSAKVALKIYTVDTPEDDAVLGKLLYEQVFGDPVEWPSIDSVTPAQIEASDLRTSSANAAGAVDGAESSDEEIFGAGEDPEDGSGRASDDAQITFAMVPSDFCEGVDEDDVRHHSVPCELVPLPWEQPAAAPQAAANKEEHTAETDRTPARPSEAYLRKTPTRLSTEHQRWVLARHTEDFGADFKRGIGTRQWFQKVLDEGVAGGHLLDGHTLEGIRSFVQREKKCAFEEQLRVAEAAKKKQKKEERRNAKREAATVPDESPLPTPAQSSSEHAAPTDTRQHKKRSAASAFDKPFIEISASPEATTAPAAAMWVDDTPITATLQTELKVSEKVKSDAGIIYKDRPKEKIQSRLQFGAGDNR